MSSLPTGVLLAAGSSQRFGSNKLLHPIEKDISMLMTTAAKLAAVLPGSIVVISQNLSSYRQQLEQLDLRVVINDRTDQGIGTSIACGVAASKGALGWLIALADMPFIKTETLNSLAEKLCETDGIIAPVVTHANGELLRGHPVGFSRRYKQELLKLDEDIGARNVISRHQDDLLLMPTDDHGVVKDIDRLSDL